MSTSQLPEGPIVTFAHLWLLILAAKAEGHTTCSKAERGIAADALRTVRHTYRDLLVNLLVLGPACYVGKVEPWDCPEIAFLRSSGLLTVDSTDYSLLLRRRLYRAYKSAFDAYRLIETHPLTAPVISFEQLETSLNPTTGDAIDVYVSGDRATYGRRTLAFAILDHMNALGGMLEAYVADTTSLIHKSLCDMVDDQHVVTDPIDSAAIRAVDATPQVLDIDWLLDAMELRLRGIEYSDAELQLYTYTPHDVRYLWRIDDRWLGSYTFENLYARIMDFRTRECPRSFLYLHAFWRTFFELSHAIEFSHGGNRQLLLPFHRSRLRHHRMLPQHEELSSVYQVLLDAEGARPAPRSLDELMGMLGSNAVVPLRTALREWAWFRRQGDADLVRRIRADVCAARKELRALRSFEEAGAIVSYLSLPGGVANKLERDGVIGKNARLGFTRNEWISKRIRDLAWVEFCSKGRSKS